IEDLLSYGAGQSRKPSLDLARVELKRIMSRVLDDQKLALRSKGLALKIDVQDLTLTADFEKLRVIFDNLVSNAIKYSPAGGTVAIAGRHVAGHVLIDVTDQGPGIAPEERKLVFEPFYRGNLAADTLVKGTGIGLSVVREYAQMHGGNAEIVVTSTGTRVRIRLPLTPSVDAEAPLPADSAEMVR
ncbi:MAG TPA: ATP-binding protein, partial [Burkholderiales bacterium]|nr:ATP-binding protein [Burkholderiales bacterium]